MQKQGQGLKSVHKKTAKIQIMQVNIRQLYYSLVSLNY